MNDSEEIEEAAEWDHDYDRVSVDRRLGSRDGAAGA